MPGFAFTAERLDGKLYVETLEGSLFVKAASARLEILNPVGEVLKTIEAVQDGEELRFTLDGSVPGLNYHLIME